MNNPKLQKQYYNVTEIAELLGISEKTVRKYVWQKTIPYLKIGGHVRFDIDKIHAWLEQREVPTLDEIRYGSWNRRADR
jgi:excisionase family DNA binding protein